MLLFDQLVEQPKQVNYVFIFHKVGAEDTYQGSAFPEISLACLITA
jgi:hypothetical protein